MSAYFNSTHIDEIREHNITVDTNILSSCFSDPQFFQTFRSVFKDNYILIDPIVKLEFLRGEFREDLYKEKMQFLEYDKFYAVSDHQEIYKHTYQNAFNIARIYSHHGNSKVPLGDVFIISRLMIYQDKQLFLTLDKDDFSTFLFDRVTVLSFEKNAMINHQQRSILEHLIVLKFNEEKYRQCLKKLPH